MEFQLIVYRSEAKQKIGASYDLLKLNINKFKSIIIIIVEYNIYIGIIFVSIKKKKLITAYNRERAKENIRRILAHLSVMIII